MRKGASMISKREAKAFLKYVYKLESFADSYCFDKKYTEGIARTFSKLKEISEVGE